MLLPVKWGFYIEGNKELISGTLTEHAVTFVTEYKKTKTRVRVMDKRSQFKTMLEEEEDTQRRQSRLTLAEVSNQPTNPYSLEKFSSLGSLGHKPCRRWSHLLANRTAGTDLPLPRAT